MKLSEALALRADTQSRINAMRTRLQQSALVQEGEQPSEDPAALLVEHEALVTQLTDLIVRINRANLATTLPDGMTLTEAIARRDALQLRYTAVAGLVETASNRISRYSRSEIKLISTVNVAALRQQQDELARQRRELDLAIQAVNWAADIG